MGKNTSRRDFLKKVSTAGILTLTPFLGYGCVKTRQHEILIKNGLIYDGTGSDPFKADIGIFGDKISSIGKLNESDAVSVINAESLIVSPGFIDIHTHSSLMRNPAAPGKIFQGVSLDITGLCGSSEFPLKKENDTEGEFAPVTLAESCTNFREWSINHPEIIMNLGSFIGHGTIRQLVLGATMRAPGSRELDVMKDLVRMAMEQGAFGLSTGLEYNPDGFAKTEEVIELAKAVVEFNGLYVTHLRSEDQLLVEAVEEAIEISRQSGSRLLISHLKVAGKPNWNKIERVIELLENAKDEGIEIYCDRYPYLAWSTSLSFFFPGWSKKDGKFSELLLSRTQRRNMRSETIEKVEANGGWEAVMISGGNVLPEYIGRRVNEIAAQKSRDPYEFVCEILQKGNVSIVGFGMSEENTERIIKLPYCMIASDGSVRTASDSTRGHPRSFGTFPRAIRKYVTERKALSLQEMIRKVTSLPASVLGIKDRGQIKEKLTADVVVFDQNKLTDIASYTSPNKYAEGVKSVIINGKHVISNSEVTGNLPGRIIKRT